MSKKTGLEKDERSGEGIVLALETAIRGGSLALLKDGLKIGGWVGEGAISKSEVILHEIKNLLDRHETDLGAVKKIVFSRGPGSFTGIRIGMATAYGLSKSTGCGVAGVSALDALVLKASNRRFPIITAVPFGKNQIVCELFEEKFTAVKNCRTDESTTRRVIYNISALLEELKQVKEMRGGELILHRDLTAQLENDNLLTVSGQMAIVDAGVDMAELIGQLFSKTQHLNSQMNTTMPIYKVDGTKR